MVKPEFKSAAQDQQGIWLGSGIAAAPPSQGSKARIRAKVAPEHRGQPLVKLLLAHLTQILYQLAASLQPCCI